MRTKTGQTVAQPQRAWKVAAPNVGSLASLRAAVGMSQEALARTLDVSRGLIAKIEGGNAPVTEKMARKIARVFSVEVPAGRSGRGYKPPLSARSGVAIGSSPATEVLKAWARRVDVGVTVRGSVDDAGWRTLQAVLGQLHAALPDARGFQASFAVDEPEGTAPGAVGKVLMLHLGKAEGLRIRPPNAGEEADLVVESEGHSGAAIHLRWRSQGSRNPADASYRARLADRKRIYGRKERIERQLKLARAGS